MYIGKIKENVIVLFEDKQESKKLDLVSYRKISLAQVKEIFSITPNNWIETKDYCMLNGTIEATRFYNQLIKEHIDKEKPEIQKEVTRQKPSICKLVRFYGEEHPYIRICSARNQKKNYKNTVLIPNFMIKEFYKDAERVGDYVELHYSKNPVKYEEWSDYITYLETK